MLAINCQLVDSILRRFIREEIQKVGMHRLVLGLSGGLDSAVAAFLAANALGGEHVHALIMPYRESNPESKEHALILAEKAKISYEIKDISAMVDAFFKGAENVSVIRKGNKMARERMCLLYDYSAAHSALVLGTSNKTELLLGYGTIHGDLASAINPIGDLYKTQVKQLAEYLDIPRVIIEKAPSADLWIGQTDEEELGYSYEELDQFLYYLIDLRYSDELLLGAGYTEKTIHDIKAMIQKNQFKRRPPVIAKLSNRTINQDFRYCRDWGY